MIAGKFSQVVHLSFDRNGDFEIKYKFKEGRLDVAELFCYQIRRKFLMVYINRWKRLPCDQFLKKDLSILINS